MIFFIHSASISLLTGIPFTFSVIVYIIGLKSAILFFGFCFVLHFFIFFFLLSVGYLNTFLEFHFDLFIALLSIFLYRFL